MSPIVTLTVNPVIDKSSSVDRVVAEIKLRCSEPTFEPGGGGINVARAIHTLGGRARAIWTRGGWTGQLLHELLAAEHIEQVEVPIQGMVRENLIIFEESTTLQYRFGMPGPHLSEAESQRCLQIIEQLDPPPSYLVASGSLPPGTADDFYFRVVQRLPKDCRVIVDTCGAALVRAIEAGVYLIKPNLRELGQLAGEHLQDDAHIERAARELIHRGHVEVVVVSLGSGGAMLVTADDAQHIRSPTVPIRSKVGAGDSMVAGIVVRLAHGDPIDRAVRYGVAAGAAAVMTPGTALCRREDVERLYQRMS